MIRRFLSACSRFQWILLLCFAVGLSSCNFGAKRSGQGNGEGSAPSDDPKQNPQINAEGISGGGSVRAFLNDARKILIQALQEIQNGGSVSQFPLCPDRHPSCLKASNLNDLQIPEVLDFVEDALPEMLTLNLSNPVPMNLSPTPPMVTGPNGQLVARQVVARWVAPQEIVFDYEWVKQLITTNSARDAMRIALKDIGHELSHLVVVNGVRLLDDSNPPQFSGPEGGANKADAVGAYLSDFAHRRGIIDRNVSTYAPAMASWGCFDLNESFNGTVAAIALSSVTPSPYQLHFDLGNECSDITVSVKLSNENTGFAFYLPCGLGISGATCEGSLFVLKPNQRSSFSIHPEQMSQLTGGYPLLVNAGMKVSLQERVPGTGTCGSAGRVTAAKFAVYLGRGGDPVPSRTCGL